MKITAGIFLVRKDGMILICHPTGAKLDIWSIPKGMVDEGEEVIHAALRETFEETNIDVSGWRYIHRLSPVKYQKTKKELHSFAIFEFQNNFKFHEFKIKCNSNIPADKGGYPEMDGYKWVTMEEASPLLHEAQRTALSELHVIYKDINKINQ